jgi:hypothetical protein
MTDETCGNYMFEDLRFVCGGGLSSKKLSSWPPPVVYHPHTVYCAVFALSASLVALNWVL